MTYLLAAGCSWTDKDFESTIVKDVDCSFPKWPELLGKKLEIPNVVNVGLSGCSNTYIFDSCYNKIMLEKPELVCILLTEWDRRRLFSYEITSYAILLGAKLHAENAIPVGYEWLGELAVQQLPLGRFLFYLWKNNRIQIEEMIDHNLRNLLLFQSFCSQHNIKYVIMQGIRPIHVDLTLHEAFENCTAKGLNISRVEPYIKYFLKSPYIDKISEQPLVGWPFFWQIGGSTAYDKMYNNWSNFRLHEEDNHPNTLGHEFLADLFYKGYNNIYSKHSRSILK